MKKIIVVIIASLVSSCTSNQMARNWGGKQTINLEDGERLVNATWKENDLWLLTKTDTTYPQEYILQEHSSYGLLQGKVIIREK